MPSTNSSRSASSVGDSAIASARSRSSSSRVSMRKTARWPPESTGFSTAGKRDRLERGVDIRRRAEARVRRLRQAGRTERVAHRALVRQEVRRLRPDRRAARAPRRPLRRPERRDRRRSVSTPSTPMPARDLDHGVDVAEVDDLCDVGRRRGPGASALRSTAATRRPRARACSIARRWWRPAPTKRTVFTAADGNEAGR